VGSGVRGTRVPALAALLSCATVTGVSPTAVRAGSDVADVVKLERSEGAMGSWFAVVLHGPDRARLEEAADAAFAEVHRLDRLLSNYRPASEWSGVNRDAASRPVPVSPELFDLLSACLEYSRQSEGAFDITVAPLVKLWGFHEGEGAVPGRAAIDEALGRVGYRRVALDPVARTVRFLARGVEIDPGGVGKGYAVDRMVAVLREHGVEAALVSAAGSSIYGLGAPPGESRGWRVSISVPGDTRRSAAELHLSNASMSTSGSSEQFFVVGGTTFSHIIDPRTGDPAQGASSVSVVAARAIDSEAWTKPYFVNGRRWTAAHRRPGHRVFFCDAALGVACSWID
jgi:thiamine biosynthesis lipoprotein